MCVWQRKLCSPGAPVTVPRSLDHSLSMDSQYRFSGRRDVMTCARLHEWGMIPYGKRWPVALPTQWYFEAGMLLGRAGSYFFSHFTFNELFTFEGPTLSSASCSCYRTTCPLIQTELHKALALEFSWLCSLLEKINWFPLKWS